MAFQLAVSLSKCGSHDNANVFPKIMIELVKDPFHDARYVQLSQPIPKTYYLDAPHQPLDDAPLFVHVREIITIPPAHS